MLHRRDKTFLKALVEIDRTVRASCGFGVPREHPLVAGVPRQGTVRATRRPIKLGPRVRLRI